jgi:hypothetical protein
MLVNAMAIVVAAVMAMAGTAGAMAQEATPAAANLFAGLGLPELTVTITDHGYEVDKSEVPAGRYLVTIVNQGTSSDVGAGFVRLPQGKMLHDLSMADEMAAGTPMPEGGLPPEQYAWLYDAYVAGGAAPAPGASTQVVLDLRGGNYGVWADDPSAPIPATALTVTGDQDAEIEGPEPTAAVTIVEEGAGGKGFKFTLKGDFKPGPQIVEVLNTSDQPHIVVAMQYPEPITADQLTGTLMFDPASGATPPPGMLDFSKITDVGYAAVQSLGTKQWIVIDPTAGQLILACFVPDPAAQGIPHFMEGMVSLVPVNG